MQRKMSDSDASTATEAYAKFEGAEPIAPPPTPAEPHNEPTPVGDDVNLISLITDLQNYITELKDRPAAERPKLAALIPIVVWTILAFGLVFTGAQYDRYNKDFKTAKLSNDYRQALGWIGFFSAVMLGPTIIYLILAYPRLRDGAKVRRYEYNNILTKLHNHVVDNLITLEAIEENNRAPDTVLPVGVQTIRALEARERILRADQPRLVLIQTCTELKNILEILRSEMNRKQRPLTLMFAQPQDDMGLATLFAHPDEDLEAGRRPN